MNTKLADAQRRFAYTKYSESVNDYQNLVRPDGMVHRTLFTDPEIFNKEMIKIFGGTWVFLLHESEIPNPGDFKTVTIGRRPVIVTRSADGDIHALLNRCTHRGSLICEKLSGHAERFQCPYHGWTFSNKGELLSVTFAEGYSDKFDKQAHNLGKVPRIESYRGYVFGSLNAAVEPLLDWIGPAREVFDWSMDTATENGMRVVKSATMMYHGNWKLQNDNNGDMYHVPFVHKSTLAMTQKRHGRGKSLDHFRGDSSAMYVQNLGHGHKLIDQRPSIGSVWERARPVPGRETYASRLIEEFGEEHAKKYLDMTGRAGINLIFYPNFLVTGAGNFNVYEPIAVDKTIVHMYTVILDDAPPEVNTLRLRFAEDFVSVGNRDDNEIFERIQYALETTPEMEWLDFSKGLGTDREIFDTDGSITGNISDETGIRGSYVRWLELMTQDAETSVVI